MALSEDVSYDLKLGGVNKLLPYVPYPYCGDWCLAMFTNCTLRRWRTVRCDLQNCALRLDALYSATSDTSELSAILALLGPLMQQGAVRDARGVIAVFFPRNSDG